MESYFHMYVRYFVSDHCQTHKKALVLISSSFHTLSVNSQITLLLADFVCNKCFVLILGILTMFHIFAQCAPIFDGS